MRMTTTEYRTVIYGGAGDDSISCAIDSWNGRFSTMIGGSGNDTFTGSNGYADVFLYQNGDGNDVITNYDTNDWIRITDGTSFSTQVSSSDVIINVGSGSIRLQNAYGKTLNVASANFIFNDNSSSVVPGTSGRDFIYNNGYRSTIYANAGNDVIDNRAQRSMLFGGAGNDSINTGINAYYGQGATIIGGTGNDTLTGADGYADVFLYRNGDGNDVITNYDSNDTIKITDESRYSTQVSSSDVIVRVGSGSIRLQNAYGKTINVVSENIPMPVDEDDDTVEVDDGYITNYTDNVVVYGTGDADSVYNNGVRVLISVGAGDDTINNYGSNSTILAGAGKDRIINTADYVTITGGTGNDYISNSGSYNVYNYAAGDGNDTVYGFGSTDTLRITDSANYKTLTSGSDFIVSIGSGSVRIKDVSSANVSGGHLVSGASVSSGVTINNSESYTLISGTAYADSIYNSESADHSTINGKGGNDTISCADLDYGSVNGGAGNDSIRGYFYHSTITGGKGNDMIINYALSPNVYQFASDGGNDLIQGFNSSDTLQITAGKLNNYYADGDDLIVQAKGTNYAGTIRLQDVANYYPIKVKVGSGTVRTINTVSEIRNTTRNKTITGTGVRDSINNRAKNVTINAGAGNDTITTYGNNVSVFGGNGNDSLVSTGGAKVTLHGGAGDDILTGSANAEVFQFRSDGGDDIITNFSSNDTLHIAAGALSTHYVDGSDLIVVAKGTSYTGTVRFWNAAYDRIKVKVGSGAVQTINYHIVNSTDETIVSGPNGRGTIENYGNYATINAGTGNDYIYNNSYYAKIDGGAGNDLITNANDAYGTTLHGGNGNDTITGSEYCADMFLFRSDGGKDIITNFSENDTLKITAGNIQNYYVSGSDYVVNVKGNKYSGSVTLQGAADIGTLRKSGNSLTLRTSSYELPSDDYWFESDAAIDDPIVSIDLNFDQLRETFKQSALDRLTSSARYRLKK